MLVACHKAALVPQDGFYLPVHVGHALNPRDHGFQPDDEGDNISTLNGRYSELTAVYWAWKNLDADAVGLSHYRRYFRGSQLGPNHSRILSLDDASSLLHQYDVVLAKPRNYVVETIESHYRNAHIGSDLDVLRDVVARRSPEYLHALDEVLNGRKLSLYNMFLMRRPQFDAYAEWIFGTLAMTAERLGDESDRTSYQRRTLGFLGERLTNVWAATHADDLRLSTVPVVNTEGEPKIRKAIKFAQRKLGIGDSGARLSG
jgi:hypothetical protein